MCSPAIALMAAGAGAGAYGAYSAQSAQNKALEYQAKLQERNASIADIQAEDAAVRGALAEKQLAGKVAQLKGTQRAAFGASGVTVGEGTALQTVADTAAMGAVDAVTLRYNTALEVWGKKAEAGGYRAEAAVNRMGKGSPGQAAALSLLSSGASVGGSMLANKGGSRA